MSVMHWLPTQDISRMLRLWIVRYCHVSVARFAGRSRVSTYTNLLNLLPESENLLCLPSRKFKKVLLVELLL